jgi:CheY-like chemotaxis protein
MDALVAGGTLTITTHAGEGGTAVITVRDTGVGMGEAIQRRIFEPFFSTKGESGSGLGLSMTYSIVKRHGGEIAVESAPGQGTTFTLVFAGETHVRRFTPRAEPPATRRGGRILLVDDDTKVRDTLAEILTATGHTVTAASGGTAALAEFIPGRFDAVVSNLGMPSMNGWELAERLRATDGDIAILFVTGWGLRDEEMSRLESLRITRCLFKPVRPDELDAALQVALAPV